VNNIKTKLIETKEETTEIHERINILKGEVKIMTKTQGIKKPKAIRFNGNNKMRARRIQKSWQKNQYRIKEFRWEN
jgi:hypothetical protein